MVLNPDKCNFVVLGDPIYTCNFACNGTTIECCKEEKVLGIAIDEKLTYPPQIGNIIKKVNQKLHAISRVKRYMDFEQNKLMSTFIKSQFSYCPLVWMICSRTSMNKLNNIHEECLRLTTNNHDSNFNDYNNLTPVHKTCINYLMIEAYKYLHGLSPE